MTARLYVVYCAAIMLLVLVAAQAMGVGRDTVEFGRFQLAPTSSPWVTHSLGN